MIKMIVPYSKGYRKETILSPVFVIFEVLLELAIPFIMSILVDVGVSGKDFSDGFISRWIQSLTTSMNLQPQTIEFILFVGAIMVIMAMLSLLFGVLSGKFAAIAANGFAKNIRTGLFSKIQSFSFYNIDKFSTASLVTRVTTDVTNAQQAFQMIIRICFRAPIMLIIASIMAISINAELSIILIFAVPFLGIAVAFLSVKAFGLFKKMFKNYDALNLRIQENLISIRVVKAFVKEDHETEQFREKSAAVAETSKQAERIIIWMAPIMQFTMYSAMIAIYFIGGKKIVAGEMNDGQLFSFIAYMTQILMSLMMISMILVNLVLSRASLSRIEEVLNEVPDISDENVTENIPVENGSIEFKNVSFSYLKNMDKCAVKNLNFSIKSGETVGILGGTGSGKTSIVQLIPRLYDTTQGDVEVAGHNVKDYKLDTLRESVSMVLQNNVLFSGTIRDNLKWGDENATQEEIEQVCKIAQADEFIKDFPDGYDTDLGQGGVNVSGGQKQRLCIARALLKKPAILILDDSTSAVDTATDKKIRDGLKKYNPDTTVIIIAQRVNSVIDADKIIVLDEGNIDAIGTHDELLKSNKIYQEVYYSQTNTEEGGVRQ